MKIVAVVVTFNRHRLLGRLLRQLMSQTRPPDEICIIDNASHDETSQFVASEFPDLFYFRSERNLGGAGGFALAMELFLQGDGDALLLCDDDGTAAPTMLEELERASHRLPFANALVLDEADNAALAFTLGRTASGVPLKRPLTTVVEMKAAETDGVVFDLACPFNGTLLRRDLIEAVGVVSHRMFIWGDEIEYMTRTIERGFRLGTVVSAILHHPKSVGTVKTSATFGAVTIPNRARAQIAFRNSGRVDTLRKRRLRGFLGCCRRTLKFLAVNEWRLGLLLPIYYMDGLLGLYSLHPAQAGLDKAFSSNAPGSVQRGQERHFISLQVLAPESIGSFRWAAIISRADRRFGRAHLRQRGGRAASPLRCGQKAFGRDRHLNAHDVECGTENRCERNAGRTTTSLQSRRHSVMGEHSPMRLRRTSGTPRKDAVQPRRLGGRRQRSPDARREAWLRRGEADQAVRRSA